jgi:alkyl sulfatase BDS1-like metallo-beta-lactamase superfamily hydrolase
VAHENLLDEGFRRMSERFRADQAVDTRAVVHWRITEGSDPNGYDRYEMVVEHGRLAVRPGRTRDAHVMVTLSAADFLRIVDGRATVPELFTGGQLRVRGDVSVVAALPVLFGEPLPSR